MHACIHRYPITDIFTIKLNMIRCSDEPSVYTPFTTTVTHATMNERNAHANSAYRRTIAEAVEVGVVKLLKQN